MSISRVEQMKHIESKVGQCNKKFRADRQSFIAWNRVLGRWPVNYIQSQERGITLTTRCTGESVFDPLELWVMGPPCGFFLIGAVTSCTGMSEHSMSEGSLLIMSATTSVPRARDEENHFPARRTRRTNRQGSRPSVATEMSSTIVTGSCWQNCTPRCLHKQENITA